MTRAGLFWLAGGLAVAGAAFLLFGISLQSKDIRSHVANSYRVYNTGTDESRYACDGPPRAVADQIAAYQPPQARATDRGTEYLRYEDDVVTVGPDGTRPCSVRVEDINKRYSSGGFIFLGPGFTPGSPAGGSGGSPGGPDGTK
ncbi:DUF4247 domain-containing protein [Mycobacterium sp. B14F4]|uniref:DUF4247 domain-containing protein n=1 Tax=Mycobacterium sp. B14F4 TaxID=3153565 RepID=UPI00325D48D3